MPRPTSPTPPGIHRPAPAMPAAASAQPAPPLEATPAASSQPVPTGASPGGRSPSFRGTSATGVATGASELVLKPSSALSTKDKAAHKECADRLKEKLSLVHNSLKNPQGLSREKAESLSIELLHLEGELHRTGVVMTPSAQHDFEQGFERLQDHAMREHFKESAKKLSEAWPKAHPRGAKAPEEFTKLAEALHEEKNSMLVAAYAHNGDDNSKKYLKSRLKTALDCANILHGKAGHNDNVVQACAAFLDNPKHVAGAFGPDGPDAEPSQIIAAAKYHGLADSEVPVSVLSAKAPPSAADQKKHIETRSQKSAEILGGILDAQPSFSLVDAPQIPPEASPEDAATLHTLHQYAALSLVSHTRLTPETAANPRSKSAQFLDLMDRVVAMAAKPFFQVQIPKINFSLFLKELESSFEAGEVDAKELIDLVNQMMAKESLQVPGSKGPSGAADAAKIFSAVAKSLQQEKVHIDADLMAQVRAFAESGALDTALTARRPEDLYVRT
jgi:hypothetical protein